MSWRLETPIGRTICSRDAAEVALARLTGQTGQTAHTLRSDDADDTLEMIRAKIERVTRMLDEERVIEHEAESQIEPETLIVEQSQTLELSPSERVLEDLFA